jgi:hypothetical protein
MAEAMRRCPNINFEAQKYTESGAKFIQRFLEKRALEECVRCPPEVIGSG